MGCAGNGGDAGGGSGPGTGGKKVQGRLSIEEALFEMVDGEFVYMKAFQDRGDSTPGVPQAPGPILLARTGDAIELFITNNLRETHGFSVLGMPETAITIPPGETRTVSFHAPAAGTWLYLDHLNAPVNRVLGLHGVMVVLPGEGSTTPYSSATLNVRRLFEDLGATAHFPGEPWRPAPPFNRERIWLFNSIDPRFNALAKDGSRIDPDLFIRTFLPRYFTINGLSGAFASHDETIFPSGRIGQPHLIRILNAGMAAHSPHIHANHWYVTAVNNTVQENVLQVDTVTVAPTDRVDCLLPFVRPPDIPGDPRTPLRDLIPNELMLVHDTPQSPLEWPMHCHMEMSQTAAGGNYPQGLVTHWTLTGDVDGIDFPVPPGHGS
jgi:FtsP/CotA-like multicopper oxidase with cupredoxin domain